MTREELIRIFKEWKRRDEERLNQADTFENIEIYDSAIKALEERKKGKWIPIPFALDYESDAKCSLCQESLIDAIEYNYCPNCGAKMEVENESNL